MSGDFPRLLTPDEAAKALGMSRRTLDEHTRNGEISYINIGRGLKRKRAKYDPVDLERFKERRRRTDACRSTAAMGSTTSTFGSTVYDFTALLEQRRNAKPKRSRTPPGSAPAKPRSGQPRSTPDQ